MEERNLQLLYTLLCDDVRIEMGNKISLMGVFQNIMVEKLPASLIKFAIVNHLEGEGNYNTEVRILSPDKSRVVVTSQPTEVSLVPNSYTDNVSFFVNVVFPAAGTYWVQTLTGTDVLEELPLIVTDMDTVNRHTTNGHHAEEQVSETVN